MIKATMTGRDGDRVCLLGLTRKNLERLFEDNPMKIDLAAAPPDGLGIEGGPTIVLIGGETEESMMKQLAPLIGPGSRVHRGPDQQ